MMSKTGRTRRTQKREEAHKDGVEEVAPAPDKLPTDSQLCPDATMSTEETIPCRMPNTSSDHPETADCQLAEEGQVGSWGTLELGILACAATPMAATAHAVHPKQ